MGLFPILLIGLYALIAIIAGSLFWLVRYLLIVLPNMQNDALPLYGRIVVNQIELKYPGMESTHKRQLALENVRDLFREHNIMVPGETSIESAIDSAFYQMKQEQSVVELEQLRDELMRLKKVTSLKLPAINLWRNKTPILITEDLIL